MALTNTEMSLVGLERVVAYAEQAQETNMDMPGDEALREWPNSGEVVFDNVTMRYGEGLPLVLNGVSFKIPGGTSVGVVGRTGSGKSSLFQAMFQLYPLDSGLISIDGVNITSIGLHALRGKLSIIPQDPVGFNGSLRFNLDPLGIYNDDALYEALENVQLRAYFEKKKEGLKYPLTSGGENLSVGQRQLVCAARALLRKSKILVLDEATASVDLATDALIQEVLRKETQTKQLTTITIAHRINTILGSNNVLVLEKGLVLEFGATASLIADKTSNFYALAHEAGAKHDK